LKEYFKWLMWSPSWSRTSIDLGIKGMRKLAGEAKDKGWEEKEQLPIQKTKGVHDTLRL
jgi:hypothetical protein